LEIKDLKQDKGQIYKKLKEKEIMEARKVSITKPKCKEGNQNSRRMKKIYH
jgi:hypothetical protein